MVVASGLLPFDSLLDMVWYLSIVLAGRFAWFSINRFFELDDP